DRLYIKNLIKYITSSYQERFYINSFTEKNIFLKYLNEETDKIDILLISYMNYSDDIYSEKINTMIVLTEGNINKDFNGVKAINKYQRVSSLVSEILNIFSESTQEEVYLPVGEKKTKIIGVYSISGGAGKTSVSAAASIISARNNKEIFYLNLESINSSLRFFESNSNHSISKLFYYIKERDKNLQLKIEAIKSVDTNYNVHYFQPQDSALELDDLKPDELTLLVDKFRLMGQYEFVFIDMNNAYDNKNIELIKACDKVIVLLDYNPISDYKVNIFEREIDILSNRLGINIFDKLMPVINKFNPNMYSNYQERAILQKDINVKIPFDIEVYSQGFLSTINNNESLFTRGIHDLLNKLL
ncbi:MAG: hypothetical protein ABF289_17915, partial [Clostridiales bacterium]